jgi:hypothetical protein
MTSLVNISGKMMAFLPYTVLPIRQTAAVLFIFRIAGKGNKAFVFLCFFAIFVPLR